MAMTAPPLLLCLVLCLCCCAACLRADEGRRQLPAGGGYSVRAVAVDKGGARLRAELVAADDAGGGRGSASAAYGEDVRKLDVYARRVVLCSMIVPIDTKKPWIMDCQAELAAKFWLKRKLNDAPNAVGNSPN
nr:uncharacterized protein LOC117852198 [Setaria viridis]